MSRDAAENPVPSVRGRHAVRCRQPASACLFLGAEPGFRLPDGFDCELSLVQGFRPDFLALQRDGHRVGAKRRRRWLRGGAGAVRPPSWPERARASPRRSSAVADGGLVVVAGGKEDGVASLAKRAGQAGRRSTGRRRNIMAWPSGFARPADRRAACRGTAGGSTRRRWSTAASRRRRACSRTSAIDPGSQLLAERCRRICRARSPTSAPAGATCPPMLIDRCARVASVDLYEADYRVAGSGTPQSCRHAASKPRFFWHDLARASRSRRATTRSS